MSAVVAGIAVAIADQDLRPAVLISAATATPRRRSDGAPGRGVPVDTPPRADDAMGVEAGLDRSGDGPLDPTGAAAAQRRWSNTHERIIMNSYGLTPTRAGTRSSAST